MLPDLKGLTFDEAKEQLNAKGLGIKNAGTVASDQYDEGQIVSQTPDALTKAEANTTVEVTLSSGKGEFLKELDLTEGRATGIPTIQQKLRENGSPRATIETDE